MANHKQMDKEGIYDGILLNRENEWNFAIWKNMDRPSRYHAKWNVKTIHLCMKSNKQNDQI